MDDHEPRKGRRTFDLFGRSVAIPRSRPGRLILGWALVAGGALGFLPVLGFWMIPLGLTVLSIDNPRMRRTRRRFVSWFGRWRNARRSTKKSVDEE
ncbi:hypothetical protein [Notoacmeibacter ruber]|uniref:Uncharacterized protein n=1 Tax=Notoacmeibacter ruber TaxID=2670375 RepID=A0A3L7JC43_9HYPH|nr:hypothetical protein [Notoacmeibacter ruber]RLQ88024.1 hypothetical protein D8780_07195 [Notoacmeibacter ruber]